MWWPETGSNRRRRPFQGRALPLSYLALAYACHRGSPRTTARLIPSVAPALSGELATGGEPATQTHPKYSNPTPYRQLSPLALSFLITHTARIPMLRRIRISASV